MVSSGCFGAFGGSQRGKPKSQHVGSGTARTLAHEHLGSSTACAVAYEHVGSGTACALEVVFRISLA